MEHRGDLGKHSLMEKLMKEFLPPIEREDIMALTNIIDDVTDVLDEVLTNLYMYNIRSLRPEALEFAALIRKCCAAMKEMLEDFRNFRRSPTPERENHYSEPSGRGRRSALYEGSPPSVHGRK